MIRPFSTVPQAVIETNLLLSACAANTTTEIAFDPTVLTQLSALKPEMTVLIQPRDALTGAVAFPAGLGIVGAYVKPADGKLYVRFSNSTAGALGAATTCSFKILGL